MFWKKKKDNKIIFWTNAKGLPDIVPIRESKYFIPDWFKKVPSFLPGGNELTDPPTVKRCPSFIDFFKTGYVLPAWCDFHLKIEEDKFYVQTPGENAFPAGFHPSNQFIDHLPEHEKKNVKLVFKPNNPWKAKTPKGVKMLQLPMSYHFNPDFYVLTGVLDTCITHQFHPQIIFNRAGEFLIKRGTPLAMYIPIRTEEFDLVVREQTKEDTNAFGKQDYATGSVFNSKLQKYEKILKDRSGEKP